MKIVDANLYLRQTLNMPRGRTERIGRWALKSLREGRHRVRKRLEVKLLNLRKEEKERKKSFTRWKNGFSQEKDGL